MNKIGQQIGWPSNSWPSRWILMQFLMQHKAYLIKVWSTKRPKVGFLQLVS